MKKNKDGRGEGDGRAWVCHLRRTQQRPQMFPWWGWAAVAPHYYVWCASSSHNTTTTKMGAYYYFPNCIIIPLVTTNQRSF